MAATSQGSDTLQKKFRSDFGGGTNYYAGSRQVKDNESPLATNCDFYGTGSVGARLGYLQVGSNLDGGNPTQVFGMCEYHTAAFDYLVKFFSRPGGIELGYSDGSGDWTGDDPGSRFTDQIPMDAVEANYLLYTFNGVDAMYSWAGPGNWQLVTDGKTLLYGAYYNDRVWGVDPDALDTVWFSVSGTADFSSAGSGSITVFPGSGARVSALHVFKDDLYVFLEGAMKGIFKVTPASVADTFSVTMITNTIGCVSHRSVAQVENDLYFAAEDGIYTLGSVQLYTDIRTTNKSLRMQPVFDALSGPSKRQLVGRYFNFKYHLFYPLYGGDNDSCMVFDIRYQALQDWRNIAANDATAFTDATGVTRLYFGRKSDGSVFRAYSGSLDDTVPVASYWSSKSFDEGYYDTEKLYLDTTFVFSQISGTISLGVIFNDTSLSASQDLTQAVPQGGFGFAAWGRAAFGANRNMAVVSQVANQPLRLRAKGQKFAVQYSVTANSQWTLNDITQTFVLFSHYKFPSDLKLTAS